MSGVGRVWSASLKRPYAEDRDKARMFIQQGDYRLAHEWAHICISSMNPIEMRISMDDIIEIWSNAKNRDMEYFRNLRKDAYGIWGNRGEMAFTPSCFQNHVMLRIEKMDESETVLISLSQLQSFFNKYIKYDWDCENYKMKVAGKMKVQEEKDFKRMVKKHEECSKRNADCS